MMTRSARLLALASTAMLSACLVGPNYVRPGVTTPPHFKEAEGWIPAQPADAAPRGDWWAMFNDPVLNDLEKKVVVSNQNLAAAEAAYRQAHALVAEDRAQLVKPRLQAALEQDHQQRDRPHQPRQRVVIEIDPPEPVAADGHADAEEQEQRRQAQARGGHRGEHPGGQQRARHEDQTRIAGHAA